MYFHAFCTGFIIIIIIIIIIIAHIDAVLLGVCLPRQTCNLFVCVVCVCVRVRARLRVCACVCALPAMRLLFFLHISSCGWHDRILDMMRFGLLWVGVVLCAVLSNCLSPSEHFVWCVPSVVRHDGQC